MSSLKQVLRVSAVKSWQPNRGGKTILPEKTGPPSKEHPRSSDMSSRAPRYFIRFDFIYSVSVTVSAVSRRITESQTPTSEQQQWRWAVTGRNHKQDRAKVGGAQSLGSSE